MRVLAIDGGGIRGIIPAIVMAELERRTGRRIAELFDLVAGTSTGGILALALTQPGAPAAEEAVRIYERDGGRIFDRSLLRRVASGGGYLDERYGSTGLEAVLREQLAEGRLSDLETDVLITAYEIEGRFAFFFRSSRAREDRAHDFTLVDAGLATSAAPTYFEPVEVRDLADAHRYALVDGGVFAGNPAMCALAELASAGAAPPVTMLLSLGTGALTRPLPSGAVRGWGRLEWAPRIVDVVFDGVAETVDFQASQLLGDRYVRMQTDLVTAADDLDDASPGNIARLRADAEHLLEAAGSRLDRVVAELAASDEEVT
jgi:patatin-like phospholipase/acyl hydrolase